MDNADTLSKWLAKARQNLPRGGSLDYRIDAEAGILWLNRLLLPSDARNGAGSRLLARILEQVDRARMTVDLNADPTDRPGDPATYDLVRWYSTFGFKPLSANEDGVQMRRTPQPTQTWERLLSSARAAPRLTQDEFETWRQAQEMGFSPALTPMSKESGPGHAMEYDDGCMYGTIVPQVEPDGTSRVEIHEWNSRYPSQGHSTRALQWLRSRFGRVSAHGIGEIDEDGVGDISTLYWQHQQGKGRVDEIFLDDGTELVSPAPRRRHCP